MTDYPPPTTGHRLRLIREAAGLSTADLADRMGVSRARVGQVERQDEGEPSEQVVRAYLWACLPSLERRAGQTTAALADCRAWIHAFSMPPGMLEAEIALVQEAREKSPE